MHNCPAGFPAGFVVMYDFDAAMAGMQGGRDLTLTLNSGALRRAKVQLGILRERHALKDPVSKLAFEGDPNRGLGFDGVANEDLELMPVGFRKSRYVGLGFFGGLLLLLRHVRSLRERVSFEKMITRRKQECKRMFVLSAAAKKRGLRRR